MKRWTAREIAFLREHAGVMPSSEIAEHLHRSEQAVWTTMHRRKIRGRTRRVVTQHPGVWLAWTRAEYARLKDVLHARAIVMASKEGVLS